MQWHARFSSCAGRCRGASRVLSLECSRSPRPGSSSRSVASSAAPARRRQCPEVRIHRCGRRSRPTWWHDRWSLRTHATASIRLRRAPLVERSTRLARGVRYNTEAATVDREHLASGIARLLRVLVDNVLVVAQRHGHEASLDLAQPIGDRETISRGHSGGLVFDKGSCVPRQLVTCAIQ